MCGRGWRPRQPAPKQCYIPAEHLIRQPAVDTCLAAAQGLVEIAVQFLPALTATGSHSLPSRRFATLRGRQDNVAHLRHVVGRGGACSEPPKLGKLASGNPTRSSRKTGEHSSPLRKRLKNLGRGELCSPAQKRCYFDLGHLIHHLRWSASYNVKCNTKKSIDNIPTKV